MPCPRQETVRATNIVRSALKATFVFNCMLDLLAMAFAAGLAGETEKPGSTPDEGAAFLLQPPV